MSNSIIYHFKSNSPKGLIIIDQTDSLYHYARVISNTRFGHQPIAIAYCKNAIEVQYCLKFCNLNNIMFRVRSGGHQHEGMSSGNGVIIIDLSQLNKIERINHNEAWIPVGKQLETVYKELEKDNQTIPGGGCQSVNVGGITQGGGWGYSIRKFGMTCDSVLEAEIVLADGSVKKISEHSEKDLFWAIKGGGGGNFGIVTRFRFRLSTLTPKVTSFALTWKSPQDVKKVIQIWMDLHAGIDGIKLDPALSSSCTMIISDPTKTENGKRELKASEKSFVDGRMGGQFYGSKGDLTKLLRYYFKNLIPPDSDFAQLKEVSYESSKKCLIESETKAIVSLARHQSAVANFLNPTNKPEQEIEVTAICPDRNYLILPEAPSSTCDRPHPHKISSSFPKNYSQNDNKKMVETIYDYLSKCCYYGDVNKYMSFHCLGGAVKDKPEKRVFAFSEKPYLLQIQCWWDDISNAFTNQQRNEEYLQWVADFRTNLSPLTEGSFINFPDRYLVKNPETKEGKIELLKIYYKETNLNKLREVKSKYDPNELFTFEMSIPRS